MIENVKFAQAMQQYGATINVQLKAPYHNVVPNKPFRREVYLQEQSDNIVSPANTAVLSVAAYENDSYRKTEVFMRSARKQNIPLRWLSFREQWHGFTYHKLWQFLRQMPYLREQGFRYAFLLDAFDIVFTDDLQTLCDKANKIYEKGTILYNRELTGHIFPYKDEYFTNTILAEGVHLNAGACFGSLEAFEKVFMLVLELQRELMADAPRAGIAEYCMRDRANFYEKLPKFINDDQLLLLMTSLYYPELLRTDDERYLFAWTQEHSESLANMRARGNLSGKPNNASIIHSSVTAHSFGVDYWRNWCQKEDLI